MRAVIASRPGGPEVLTMASRPVPVPDAGQVLVRIEAAGINRADLAQREGNYSPPPGASDVLGLECAGEVVARGPGVQEFAVGDKVCALLSAGGYAEYVSVPVGQVAVVPSGLSMVEAASVMEAAATVWSNVFSVGGLAAGHTLLVHGGTSGIGTMAIQLATAAGARVVATAGSEEKVRVCRELGADVAIDYRRSDFAEEMASRGIRADVILDIVGGPYLSRNVRSLNVGGRLIVIGMQDGAVGELELDQLFVRRASVTATSLRARPAEEKAEIVRGTVAHVWPLLASGVVKPRVDEVFALEDVQRAHEVLASSAHIGKLVLTL